MTDPFDPKTAPEEDTPFDRLPAPPDFDDFHGQEKVKDVSSLMVEAAKQRDDVLEHVLSPALPTRQTTLANIIAAATGTTLHTTSGPQIEKAGDLAGILTNLQKGDLLFIDGSTASTPPSRNTSTPPWRTTDLTIIIDSGPSARSIQLNLPKFTLVAATTRAGKLTAPLRSRFGLINPPRLLHRRRARPHHPPHRRHHRRPHRHRRAPSESRAVPEAPRVSPTTFSVGCATTPKSVPKATSPAPSPSPPSA